MGPTDTGDTSGERKVERYREAAHAALDQLDWIIGFCTAFGSRRSPTLSRKPQDHRQAPRALKTPPACPLHRPVTRRSRR
jgi:hypothetical protein